MVYTPARSTNPVPRALHNLGLCVAAGLGIRGLASMMWPEWMAHEALGLPRQAVVGAFDGTSLEALSGSIDSCSSTVAAVTQLMAARDVTIAVALWSYAVSGRYVEMGKLILCSMWVCLADVVVIWQNRGALPGFGVASGGGLLGLIGWQLISVS